MPGTATATPIHPAHAANRKAMAIRLADFLKEHGGGHEDGGAVAWLTDGQWARVAELAGEQTPDHGTRAEVVKLLGAWDAIDRPADPFAGLA